MPSYNLFGGDLVKKIVALIIAVSLCTICFSSCKPKKQKFTESYIDYFDTVASVTGYEESQSEFNKVADIVERELKEYHKLFDIYNSYANINNIKSINDNAGIKAVPVDKKIIELLDFCKEMYTLTNGKTDITMGAVLRIWHDYRSEGVNDPEKAELPGRQELDEAGKKHGFNKVIIDRDNNTVFISEKGLSLDVGAVAKGYATQKIAERLEALSATGYALNIGGNIRVIGDKESGEKWTASVANPDTKESMMTVSLDHCSFVTSGSYIRYYTVDGVRYHHIIDNETLFPKNEFTSVSVLTDNSGIADALSTALFCMSYDEGVSLINSLSNTEAVWIRANGEALYSEDFLSSVVKEN